MKALRLLLCAGLLLIAAGAQAAKIKTEHDSSVDFRGPKSFAWMKSPLQETGRAVGPDLAGLDRRVRSAVDRELSAKGWAEGPAEEASFLVDYSVGVEARVDERGTGAGAVPESRMGQGSYVRAYEEATLILTFTDPESRKMVWRGWASIVLGDPEKTEKTVNKAVRKLLKRFPPR